MRGQFRFANCMLKVFRSDSCSRVHDTRQPVAIFLLEEIVKNVNQFKTVILFVKMLLKTFGELPRH